MKEKRQRITARAVVPVDFAAESRLLLEEISKMKTSLHNRLLSLFCSLDNDI